MSPIVSQLKSLTHLLQFLQKPPINFVLASTRIWEHGTCSKHDTHLEDKVNGNCEILGLFRELVCTIAELDCRNQNGIWSDEMNPHSCIHCNYQWLKQSNIGLCSVRWSIFGLFPCYPCPKLRDHLLLDHQNMPEGFWIHISWFLMYNCNEL